MLQTYKIYITYIFPQVTMVKWNEPYQKLASCDSTGIIFVWIKYEYIFINITLTFGQSS